MRIPFPVPVSGRAGWDVVGLGLNSLDLVAVVAEHPSPDSKQQLRSFSKLPGGETATAVAACARLGWRTRYVGRFGEDDLGALSRDSLLREGVDLSEARVVPGATNRFALILVDAGGHRTVLWDRDPLLAMHPGDVPHDAVTSGRILLVDGHDTAAAAEAARIARRAGIPTVVDVETVGPGVSELLQEIDAIIVAQTFPSALTGYGDLGRALEAMAREYRAPLVGVTLGADGSLARCGGREIRTPSFAVECVDSTGAGDVFRGGFASACLRHPDGAIEEVLAYANAAAALNCRALGARGGLPEADEIEPLLVARRIV